MTHITICREPFLSLMLTGVKKVESRFSKMRALPFGQVARGDVIYLKKSGGPIVAICKAGKVEYCEIKNAKDLAALRKRFSKSICSEAEKGFWDKRKNARYASFIELTHMKKIPPQTFKHKGRQGWVIKENLQF